MTHQLQMCSMLKCPSKTPQTGMSGYIHLHCTNTPFIRHVYTCTAELSYCVLLVIHKVLCCTCDCRLQNFVDTIAENFLKKAPDLMSKEFERTGVKLHATVMNSKFPNQRAEGKEAMAKVPVRGRGFHRESFDATGIFKVCSMITIRSMSVLYQYSVSMLIYYVIGNQSCVEFYG